jgi:hypothetical protein
VCSDPCIPQDEEPQRRRARLVDLLCRPGMLTALIAERDDPRAALLVSLYMSARDLALRDLEDEAAG